MSACSMVNYPEEHSPVVFGELQLFHSSLGKMGRRNDTSEQMGTKGKITQADPKEQERPYAVSRQHGRGK